MNHDQTIHWFENQKLNKCGYQYQEIISAADGAKALRFHRSLGEYEPTPLLSLKSMADASGLGNIWVKDESTRFGLGAFKALGASYAVYRVFCDILGVSYDDDSLTFEQLKAMSSRKEVVFTCATDGNHGKGVAWAVEKLGQSVVVYVPDATVRSRIEAIKAFGAEVHKVRGTYNNALDAMIEDARINHRHIVSDMAWPGYTEVPALLLKGYATMFAEIQEQLRSRGVDRPTVIFIQAGAGALAGAVVGFYKDLFAQHCPYSVLVEPDRAACVFESARAGDGEPHLIEGNQDSIMAGLCCGKPSLVSWPILRDEVNIFMSVPDCVAAEGMRRFAHPLGTDPVIVSGESGAVGWGVLSLIIKLPEFTQLRHLLHLDESAQVLLINTEGDTDPVNYQQIVEQGKYPLPKRVEVCRCKSSP